MQSPYDYYVISTPLFGFPTCEITYQGDTIRELSAPINMVEEAVDLLNCAYQEGHRRALAGMD